MAAYQGDDSQQPDQEQANPGSTKTDSTTSNPLLFTAALPECDRNQLSKTGTTQGFHRLTTEPKPENQLFGNNINMNKAFESGTTTGNDKSAAPTYHRSVSSPKGHSYSDDSTSINNQRQVRSNSGVSNDSSVAASAAYNTLQGPRVQTEVESGADPSSSTDRLKRQLSTSTSENRTSLPPLSTDAKKFQSPNFDPMSQASTNSKPSTPTGNPTPVKVMQRSIISQVSSWDEDEDKSETDRTESPKPPPVLPRTSTTSNMNKRENQVDEQNSQPQSASNSPNRAEKDKTTSKKSSRVEEQRQLDQASPTGKSNMMEYKKTDEKKLKDPPSIPERASSDASSSSSKDDRPKPQSSSAYDPSNYREDYRHIAFIPYLPSNDLKSKELSSTIRRYLEDKCHLHGIDVKCNLHFDFGVVYLRDEKDKDKLINNIRQIPIGHKSDHSVSFDAELEFDSYVVVKVDDPRDTLRTKDVIKRWEEVYPNHHLSKLHRLCKEFPNIFYLVINKVENLIESIPIREFNIGEQKATVYFRADCCFFDALPPNTTTRDIGSAIESQLAPTRLSRTDGHIDVNKGENQAVVITCNEAQQWKSFSSIDVHGQTLVKKDRLTYFLRLRPVPVNISIASIEKHKIFDGAILRAIFQGKDIVVELLSKTVYEKCLQQRVLSIDGHTFNIEPNTSVSKKENDMIDALNWYEAEMGNGKSSIMDFIHEPNHRIFRLKWDSQAFLEQFKRCSGGDTKDVSRERDLHGSTSDRHRHLLRVTVMLNTIGIVKRGGYSVNGKAVNVKSSSLNTIVYKHESVLQAKSRVRSSAEINYPYPSTTVRVMNADCLVAYEQMAAKGYRPLLLNMANAYSPGGGYRKGDGAQEENVFRRSNYYRSLDIELDQGEPTMRSLCSSNGDSIKLVRDQKMYPMDEYGAIYTTGLTAFRHTEDQGYELMENPIRDLCAIAIAAYRNPKLNDKNLLCSKPSIGTRKKIETIFAIANRHNHDCLILSAFGCGAFQNPPKHIATIFKSVIEQYAGFFKRICFAIIDDHNTGHGLNPHGNYQPFHEILHNLDVKPIRHVTVDMMVGPWRITKESQNGEMTLSNVQICYLFPCQFGAKCREIDSQSHCRKYLHPPKCPLPDGSKECDNHDHLLWFTHRTKRSGTSNSEDDEQNTDDSKQVADRRPICPWTPFHCRQHTALTQLPDAQQASRDIEKHCQEFRHICRFGGQCRQTARTHWETTIHIAREPCRDQEKCPKIHQENHVNSFSHPHISDIRHLCENFAIKCKDRQRPEHFSRFRHRCDYDCLSAIPYRGLNRKIDFVRNQQDIIGTVRNLGVQLNAKPASGTISVLKCIQGLSPIYQCSKEVFELILIQGHIMSEERLVQFMDPQNLIQLIKENEQIQPIIAQHRHRTAEKYIDELIRAIILSRQSPKTDYASAYSSMSTPRENFDEIIRNAEKALRQVLSPEDLSLICQLTMKFTEASLNLPKNLSPKKYISTVFGPNLRPTGGDIVLVLRREVMFHPDAKFAMQSNGRMRPVYESPLHCSLYGYKEAAMITLMSAIDPRLTDMDVKTAFKYLSSAQTDQLFEGHLPNFIPLDYIEEIHMPENLFSSLTSSSRMSVNKFFRDSLCKAPQDGAQYREYIHGKLVQNLAKYIDCSQQQLCGTTITLPKSDLKDYVPLPFTLTQVYDQYRRNYKRGSISDDIYIYWQSIGDMMLILSNDSIDSASNSTYAQSLVCYIAETPSMNTREYQESYSYLNYGHPSQHQALMKAGSFPACSKTFHHHCNLDQYLTYCLKLEKTTGKVTLSHAGPNSVYNKDTISYQFPKSTLNLNDLKYIYMTADSQQVPVRNMMVCFHPLSDLHPSSKRRYRPPKKESSSRSSHASAASTNDRSSSVISVGKQVIGVVGGLFGFGNDQKKLPPCRDSVNCLRQTSQDHCQAFSHPCRFSELCRNQDEEPHLTHEPHRARKCEHDKSCRRLDDAYHRAEYRHTELPDFLVPCNNQTTCQNREKDHRIKYSHGEKINISSVVAMEKPHAAPRASPHSSDDHSHASEPRPRSSANRDQRRTPDRPGSSNHRANAASNYSPSAQFQPGKFDHNQKRPCPVGFMCKNYEKSHMDTYSHSPNE